MNFMAAKNVSFSPQLETVIGVKDGLTDVAGEINALNLSFPIIWIQNVSNMEVPPTC